MFWKNNMFMTKKNTLQKISPSSSISTQQVIIMPELSSSVTSHNETNNFIIDFMGIEEFLAIFLHKTVNDNKRLWKASFTLAMQLKESKALLSLKTYLPSDDGSLSSLDRLIEMAHFLLNVENVYLLQLDPNGIDLVITHAQLDAVVGMKIPAEDLCGANGLSNRPYVVSESREGPSFIAQLDFKTGTKIKNLISAPFIVANKIRGCILITNKIPSSDELISSNGDINSSNSSSGDGSKSSNSSKGKEASEQASFGPNDEILLGFVAANAGIVMTQTLRINNTIKGSLNGSLHGTSNGSSIGSTSSSSSLSIRNGNKNVNKSSSNDSMRKNYDADLERLVDRACIELKADLISIFTYNGISKRLDVTFSKDIKGLSIPVDRGIAGATFRTGLIINVHETASDGRHNNEVDAQVGYKTNSLLCAPIVNAIGRPVGVMEALNKKGQNTSNFSVDDESLLSEFCSQAFVLMQNIDLISDCSSDSKIVLLTKFLSALSNSNNLSDIVKGIKKSIVDAVVCDYVGFFTFVNGDDSINDHLVCQSSSVYDDIDSKIQKDRIYLKDIPVQILDALKYGEMREFNIPSKSSKKSLNENFLPGIATRQALIYPILQKNERNTLVSSSNDNNNNYDNDNNSKNNNCNSGNNNGTGGSNNNGDNNDKNSSRFLSTSSVLVVVRGSDLMLPFSTPAREILSLFIAVLGSFMEELINRNTQETIISTLQSNYILTNSILGTVQDYILLFSSTGHIISWNRDISTLLGNMEDVMAIDLENERDIYDQKSPRSPNLDIGSSPRSRSEGKRLEVIQGQHYTQFFKRSQCWKLVEDMSNFISNYKISSSNNISQSAEFTSNQYPLGVVIDYQLISLDIEGLSTEREGSSIVLTVRVHKDININNSNISRSRSNGSSDSNNGNNNNNNNNKNNNSILNAISRDSALNALLPPIDSPKTNLKRRLHTTAVAGPLECDTDGLINLIEKANNILKSVTTQYSMNSDAERNITDVTSSLDHLLGSKFPVCSKTLKRDNNYLRSGLINTNVIIPDNLFSWEFNVLEISDKTILVAVLGKLFDSLQLDGLNIDFIMLGNYIRDIADKYHDNPFHNLHHATCVTHFTYMLIYATEAVKYLSPQQLFGVVLSAVVHDVDHPGNTNMFEVNSLSNLALLYNDQSVLENHHCSTAFQIMRKPSTNIFSGLSKVIAAELRKTIVSCVMATDMSVHFELVNETKKMVCAEEATGENSFEEVMDQTFLCKLLVHSADLSNPVRPFHMTQAWARRISAEFNLQVAREQELDMPVLNFMMTPDDKALCKNETGFASFVVAPMWRALSGLFPSLMPLVQQLDRNLGSWKAMLEKIIREEEKLKGSL